MKMYLKNCKASRNVKGEIEWEELSNSMKLSVSRLKYSIVILIDKVEGQILIFSAINLNDFMEVK